MEKNQKTNPNARNEWRYVYSVLINYSFVLVDPPIIVI